MVKVASRGGNPPGLSRRPDEDSDRFYPHYDRGGAQQTLSDLPFLLFVVSLVLFLCFVIFRRSIRALSLSSSLSLPQVHTCIDIASFSPAFSPDKFLYPAIRFLISLSLSLSLSLSSFSLLSGWPIFSFLLASTFFFFGFSLSLPSGDLSTA